MESIHVSGQLQLSPNSSLITFTSALHPLLSDGQTYWLAPFVTDGTEAVWNFNDQGVRGPLAKSTEEEPVTWTVFPDQVQGALEINGTVISEPASLTLLGLGVLGLLGYGRQRRKQPP